MRRRVFLRAGVWAVALGGAADQNLPTPLLMSYNTTADVLLIWPQGMRLKPGEQVVSMSILTPGQAAAVKAQNAALGEDDDEEEAEEAGGEAEAAESVEEQGPWMVLVTSKGLGELKRWFGGKRAGWYLCKEGGLVQRRWGGCRVC